MGFLKILFSTCSGTEVFTALMGNSLRRAMFHAVVMMALCSMFIAAARTPGISRIVSTACGSLDEEFGGIKIAESITPAREPEKARSIKIFDNMRIDYFPGMEVSNSIFEDDKGGEMSGVLWTPGIMLAWMRVKTGEYIALPMIYSLKKAALPQGTLTESGVLSYLAASYSTNGGFNKASGMPFQSFAAPFVIYGVVATLAVYMLKMMFSALMFNLISASIYAFFGKDSVASLRLKTLFVIGLYASFPPLIIASFFPAFDLPLLDFQTVFMLAFLTYLFVVYNKIQRTLDKARKSKREEEAGDDDW